MRWWLPFLYTALWAFVFTGCLGLVEGVLRWLMMPAPLLDGQAFGIVRSVSPFIAVYGWAGLLLAMVYFGPASLILTRRSGSPVKASAISIAAAFSAPFLIQIGFLLRETSQRGWWNQHEDLFTITAFPLFYILLVAIISRFVSGFIGRRLKARGRGLFLALTITIVFTALWPDWSEEGRLYRSSGITTQEQPAPGSPNIILITIDALRRDGTRFMSQNAPPTPALDAIASESIVYRNAWSPSCWTLPSMSALMTGLPPRAMGMDVFLGIPSQAQTLAETALHNGYRTRAVATNPFLTPDYGLDMGFQDFEHSLVLELLTPAKNSLLVRGLNHFSYRYIQIEDADIVLSKATSALKEISAEPGPWFFWTHLMDPHLPYRTHEPEAFGREAYRADLPDHPIFSEAGLDVASFWPVREMAKTIPDSLATAVRRAYDDEVTYLDARLGMFFAEFKALGIYEEALIIVAADHGEEFFEHGGFEHGHSMMPEVCGVPLVVRLPGAAGAGTSVEVDCSLWDVLPTLCQSLGWLAPDGLIGSPDLWTSDGRVIERSGTEPPELRLVEKMYYGTGHTGFMSWPWYGYKDNKGILRWYDLQKDPGALNVLDSPPESAEMILDRGQAFIDLWDDYQSRFVEEQALNSEPSAEIRRQLEALGY